jgi:hypothetical protein
LLLRTWGNSGAGCSAGGLGQVKHAEPGGGDRQGGVGAGDRLCQVDHAESDGGDRLWQEVGCGCTGCVSSFFPCNIMLLRNWKTFFEKKLKI